METLKTVVAFLVPAEFVNLFIPGKASVTIAKIPAGIVIAAAGFFARGILG